MKIFVLVAYYPGELWLIDLLKFQVQQYLPSKIKLSPVVELEETLNFIDSHLSFHRWRHLLVQGHMASKCWVSTRIQASGFSEHVLFCSFLFPISKICLFVCVCVWMCLQKLINSNPSQCLHSIILLYLSICSFFILQYLPIPHFFHLVDGQKTLKWKLDVTIPRPKTRQSLSFSFSFF